MGGEGWGVGSPRVILGPQADFLPREPLEFLLSSLKHAFLAASSPPPLSLLLSEEEAETVPFPFPSFFFPLPYFATAPKPSSLPPLP